MSFPPQDLLPWKGSAPFWSDKAHPGPLWNPMWSLFFSPTYCPRPTHLDAMAASGARQEIHCGSFKYERNRACRANLCAQTTTNAELMINFNNWSIHLHFLDIPPIDSQIISPHANM